MKYDDRALAERLQTWAEAATGERRKVMSQAASRLLAVRPEEKPTEREKEAMACLQHARTEIQSAYSAGKMRADLTAKTWAWLHRIDALFSPLGETK